MVCDVCGEEFLSSHSCPGPSSGATNKEVVPPAGFALLHYLGEAWRIVCWDGTAIRRVMDDPRALSYGLLFWVVGNTVPSLLFSYFGPMKDGTSLFGKLLAHLVVSLLSGTAFSLIQLGIIHLIAKYFCAGDGKFLQILRPLSLASLILTLQVIPVAVGIFLGGIPWATLTITGYILGNIAWVAVMVMVFDVVDGMEQLTAFVTSIASVFGLGLVVEFISKHKF
jgi:hypothetical protein